MSALAKEDTLHTGIALIVGVVIFLYVVNVLANAYLGVPVVWVYGRTYLGPFLFAVNDLVKTAAFFWLIVSLPSTKAKFIAPPFILMFVALALPSLVCTLFNLTPLGVR